MDELLASVYEIEAPNNGRIFAVHRNLKDVVTIMGSVRGGWELLPRNKEDVAVLCVSLLDTGTKTRSKEALRNEIAERGATLRFSSSSTRTYFTATCLPNDVPFILERITDRLQNTVFTQKELDISRTNIISRIKNTDSDTGTQAEIALSRMLYDHSHPNYSDTNAERLMNLAAVTLKDVQEFQKNLGQSGLIIALVGDIDPKKAASAALKSFSTLRVGTTSRPTIHTNTKVQKAQTARIVIPEKAAIDVRMGISLPIRYGDSDFFPMVLCASLLGGSFSSYLMDTLRERDGLTYHIQASLAGTSIQKDGYFIIDTSFAPALYERGVAATLLETKKFLAKGLTAKALEMKKNELVGRYVMSMSTTYGLATRLTTVAEREQPISEIAAYNRYIRAVTHKDLLRAAKRISVDSLSIASAGTFE
ncbi:MAG: peptidase domain protein [Parcubacteria group bacterium]|nr:peptidase domain protein [Parcubacteria group bacterium]